MPFTDGQILTRWRTSLTDVDCSPLTFLELVREKVLATGIPEIRISPIVRREGGVLSYGRVYLRVRRGRLFFDVSAFLSGRFLVVGYWLHKDPPGIRDLFSEIPGLNFILERIVDPATYYRVDDVENFQHAVHDAIVGASDELSERNRVTQLLEDAVDPLWGEIW